jgi:hypothetical protein
MSARPRGPVCSTRLGDDWIDLGTTCRARTAKPGPAGVAEAVVLAAARVLSPWKATFDKDHVYSRAPEAARKRDIDLRIISDDYARSSEISLKNPDYLKQLIVFASNGRQKVGTSAKKIQFFIVRGGGEGFLGQDMAKENAGRVRVAGTTTDGKSSLSFRFDNNDLIAVFDAGGGLIGAALLQRPLSIPGAWREKTANKVYDAWHNKGVSIYRNTNFDIPYLGLVVADGMKKTAWVDLHKQEATNGCIFIVDPATPGVDQPTLHDFEPRLIVDILAAIGKKPADVKGTIHLGTMRVVDLK